jgi:uncharacterized protein YecE (DUF72 family)
MTREVRIGCQSWGYEDWVTKPDGPAVFYPRGTRSSEMLQLYSRIFDTIEVDSTVYGPPEASTIESWYRKTPADFKFALKVPRRITHEFPLLPSVYPEMDLFLERAALLGEKLGPILIQFPAAFESTKENGICLRNFLARLPGDIAFAVEFRNPGWFVDWTFEELASRYAALALVEGEWVDRETMFSSIPRLTDKFAYIRLMGIKDLQVFDCIQRSRDDVLALWQTELGRLDAKTIYVYVDNYFEGFAPGTANKLKSSLGLSAISPELLEKQPSLF